MPSNDPKNLEKFNSDISKWYLFVSNLTEEVWVELKKVFEADYEMKLHFQAKFTKESSTTKGTEETTESIDSIKATYIKARQEAISVRRVLSGANFPNFHLLHPAFQLHVLRRIKVFYKEKKHINAEMEFLLPMSVSVIGRSLHFYFHLLSVFLIPFLFILQQILSCSISVFWGLELDCLIQKFDDFVNIMNTFFPFFSAQKHFNELRKWGRVLLL